MTTRITERIPYGVGQLTAGWWTFIGILLAIEDEGGIGNRAPGILFEVR